MKKKFWTGRLKTILIVALIVAICAAVTLAITSLSLIHISEPTRP